MTRTTITLCLIARNEEATLGACLSSVAPLVDEIVVVDTGSTDRTKAVAASYGAHVVDFVWVDDFAAARNESFRHATGDFIFWLDCDDVLLEDDQTRFGLLRNQLTRDVDAVSMAYHYAFDPHGHPTTVLRRHRLVRRDKNFCWHGAVHEYLAVDGHILHSDVAITHRRVKGAGDRNLRIFERRMAAGEPFTPRDLYYFGNELADHGFYPRAAEIYQSFIATGQGWVEDVIAAHGRMADCLFEDGRVDDAIEAALKSFSFDAPRAEQCCRLGYYFLHLNRLREATYWYEAAAVAQKPPGLMAITTEDCWTYLPHVQLCICYDRLGDYERAYRHNELARGYRPHDANVLHNKQYLETVRGVTMAQ